MRALAFLKLGSQALISSGRAVRDAALSQVRQRILSSAELLSQLFNSRVTLSRRRFLMSRDSQSSRFWALRNRANKCTRASRGVGTLRKTNQTEPGGLRTQNPQKPDLTSRLLDSRASVAVFDARAPRREGAKKLVWAARFPRASYPTVCGQKFRARRRSRRQKSSFSARLLRQPLTVERRSRAMGRPPQNDRALPDRALGHSLCYWRRFW